MIKRDYFAWRFNTEWDLLLVLFSMRFFFALFSLCSVCFLLLLSPFAFLSWSLYTLIRYKHIYICERTVSVVVYVCNRQFSGNCNFFSLLLLCDCFGGFCCLRTFFFFFNFFFVYMYFYPPTRWFGADWNICFVFLCSDDFYFCAFTNFFWSKKFFITKFDKHKIFWN